MMAQVSAILWNIGLFRASKRICKDLFTLRTSPSNQHWNSIHNGKVMTIPSAYLRKWWYIPKMNPQTFRGSFSLIGILNHWDFRLASLLQFAYVCALTLPETHILHLKKPCQTKVVSELTIVHQLFSGGCESFKGLLVGSMYLWATVLPPGTHTNCVAGILPPWVSMARVQRIQHELQILDVDYPVRRHGRLKWIILWVAVHVWVFLYEAVLILVKLGYTGHIYCYMKKIWSI